MQNLLRYIRAFFRALALTLRGQKPPTLEAEERHAELLDWCRGCVALVDVVNNAIAANGTDALSVKMHVEGRDVTLKHTLDVVRYHASREYPHLIRSRAQHAVLAIQALNLNDRFLVLRLSEFESLPTSIKTAMDSLAEHLNQIPQS